MSFAYNTIDPGIRWVVEFPPNLETQYVYLCNIIYFFFRLFMTKETIVLCHLRLAQTHAHPCLDHFHLVLEEVVEETVSLEDLPVLDATATISMVLVVVTAVTAEEVSVVTVEEVSIKINFLATLDLALEASLELLEENKCINCFGIDVSNQHSHVAICLNMSYHEKLCIPTHNTLLRSK